MSGSNRASLALSLALGVVCFLYRYLSYSGFSNDHFVHFSRAQQILLGELPVRDFHDPGLPLMELVSAIPQALFGRALFSEALLVFGGLAAAAALTCFAVTRLTGSLWLATLLTLFQIAMLPRSYSYPKMLLYPAVVIAMLGYLRKPSILRLSVLSIATVVSFLMRYDHGLFIAAGYAVMLVIAHWNDEATRPAGALAKYGLVTAALLTPYLVYVQSSVGLVPHVRDAVAFSLMEGERQPAVIPSFRLHLPTMLTFRTQEAIIHVRWTEAVDAPQREALEQQLAIRPDQELGDRTWRYRISDFSRTSMERIVRHPGVEDTAGIDRSALVIEPDRVDYCVLCVSAGPGLYLLENAVAWLYFLSWGLVVTAVVFVATRRVGGDALLAAVAVMTALAAASFLRDSLLTRLADIWGLLPLLLAGVVAHAWRSRRHALARASIAVVLAFTACSVAIVGHVAEELNVAQADRGLAGLYERLLYVTRDLQAPPSSARPVEGRPDARTVAPLLAACTDESDRVLAFAFMPELFYLAGRGFAAGYPTFYLGRHAGDTAQRFGLARWRSQSVPYAVAYEEELEDLSRSFPLIAEELERRYEPVFKTEAGNVRGPLIVFAERAARLSPSEAESAGAECLIAEAPTRARP